MLYLPGNAVSRSAAVHVMAPGKVLSPSTGGDNV